MRQATPSSFPFTPHFSRCRRCRSKFLRNRRDRFYCKESCQHPTMRSQVNVKESIAVREALELWSQTPSMHELVNVFERETGVPFSVLLTNLPKKRAAVHDDRPSVEEQGRTWWNVDEPADEEPTEIENRLRAKTKTVQHQGETVDEWLAGGGKINVLPPGKGLGVWTSYGRLPC